MFNRTPNGDRELEPFQRTLRWIAAIIRSCEIPFSHVLKWESFPVTQIANPIRNRPAMDLEKLSYNNAIARDETARRIIVSSAPIPVPVGRAAQGVISQ